MIKIYEAPKQFVFAPEKRKKLVKKYKNLASEKNVKMPGKSVNDEYYNNEIDDKSILVVGLGTNVKGNMQYVLDVLNHDRRFADYKVYIRTQEKTDDVVKGYIKQNNWNRSETLPTAYGRKLESCKYLITESYFPDMWIYKPGQVLIDTWHGTPLKKLGIKKNGDKAHKGGVPQKNFINASYLLYPNEFTREKLLEAYDITDLLQGKGLMLGYPRVGGLLSTGFFRKRAIKKQLAPKGEKIYAYMPTFRGYLSDEDTIKLVRNLLDYLDENLRDDQILYVNLHHHVSSLLDCSGYKHIKYFPPLIDSYELLTVTEALISDYSSVFFDYLALRKQIILHMEDYDDYARHQGLYMDLRELPFDIAKSREEVLEALNRGKTYDDSEIFKRVCEYDSKDNAKKLCQVILGDEKGLNIYNYQQSGKENIFIYTDYAKRGSQTDLLREYCLKTDKKVYIVCDDFATRESLKQKTTSAYPMMHENSTIGVSTDMKLSSAGIWVKDLYIKGEIPFEEAIKVLQYDYALYPIRVLGRAKIDTLMIYDTVNPEVLSGLALAPADKKILVMGKDIIDKIENGDIFLKDAIRYASAYCNAVLVMDKEDSERAEPYVCEYWTGKIQVIKSPEDLQELSGGD